MTWSKFAKDGKDLYAVAIEHRSGPDPRRDWKAQMHYIHADCQAQAEIHFKTQYPNRARTRIIAAAPVIGAHVQDKQGMKLIL